MKFYQSYRQTSRQEAVGRKQIPQICFFHAYCLLPTAY